VSETWRGLCRLSTADIPSLPSILRAMQPHTVVRMRVRAFLLQLFPPVSRSAGSQPYASLPKRGEGSGF
jgi:hypothetical protein